LPSEVIALPVAVGAEGTETGAETAEAAADDPSRYSDRLQPAQGRGIPREKFATRAAATRAGAPQLVRSGAPRLCSAVSWYTDGTMLKRTATAVWRGTGPKGTGTISTLSGALKDQPYGFNTRFAAEDGKAGTNPEELVGAAHASCFTMALAFQLTTAGHEPTQLETLATVSMEKQEPGWTIVQIALDVQGTVPGVTAEQFAELAEAAKKGCPLSRALAATPITMTAKLL
jgi:lipoyl-dependent peroxiredoxin